MAGRWVLLAYSSVLLVLGTLLAADHRGMTTGFVRLAQRWDTRHPRKAPDPAGRIFLGRLTGGAFAVTGAFVLVRSVADLIS